jgi:hypothetical protein
MSTATSQSAIPIVLTRPRVCPNGARLSVRELDGNVTGRAGGYDMFRAAHDDEPHLNRIGEFMVGQKR